MLVLFSHQVMFKCTELVGGAVPTPSPLAVSVAQHIKTSNSSTAQLTTPTFGKLHMHILMTDHKKQVPCTV